MNKTIEEIAQELAIKLTNATLPERITIIQDLLNKAITQAMLDALPEKHEVDPIGNADYRYCMGRNNAIEEMESAIKKMGGSDV